MPKKSEPTPTPEATPKLDFDAYQTATEATAIYPKQVGIVYTGLGLASEAGEVVGQMKKAFRDDGGGNLTTERRASILAEVGDVLWYCARLSAELGASLSDVAQANLDKLNARKQAGTITGDGDNR
jgi:NTP pyrophosphatase (non-canonical NTP hydrolase)